MYAIVETGGKQYRVKPGDTVAVERLTGEPGESLDLGRVLLVAERNWVGLWAVSLLFMFLESLGGLFFGIGILVTVPWIACSWAGVKSMPIPMSLLA